MNAVQLDCEASKLVFCGFQCSVQQPSSLPFGSNKNQGAVSLIRKFRLAETMVFIWQDTFTKTDTHESALHEPLKFCRHSYQNRVSQTRRLVEKEIKYEARRPISIRSITSESVQCNANHDFVDNNFLK